MSSSRKRRRLAIFLAAEGGLGIIALALGALSGAPPLATLGPVGSGTAQGVLAALPMLALLSLLWRSPSESLRRIRERLEETLSSLFGRSGRVELALVSLAAGVGEEMLFRGWLQAWLGENIGILPALAVASLVFGLAHPMTAVYVVLASVFGAYLGIVWLATGNLVVPIVAHAVYDFVALTTVVRR